MKVLVTGAAGNAGQATCRLLVEQGFTVRQADATGPAEENRALGEFVRYDTRTPEDVRRAVEGTDAVIHLAAWHCAHQPPVSDPTIWSVNVDGTFYVLEACRAFGIKSIVYASSMAYGWGGVYGLTKVVGEEMCRSYHEMTGAAIAMLRYHDFVPKPYLHFGSMLLRNGVDRRDVAAATVASLQAAIDRKIGLFRTVVHTNHGMPAEVVNDFRAHGRDWCESRVPGSAALIDKYKIGLPDRVEQHDLSEAKRLTGWSPKYGIAEFLTDLTLRDARSEDVANLWAPGQIPEA
jgi:nucleoside-diphosphate-sugar epimerase